MPYPIHNRFGRRAGRGLRPWLLIPKVIAVALYLGGLASVQTIWLTANLPSLAPGDPRHLLIINLTARLIETVVVPALLVAILLGVLLLLQMPRVFLRMRWLIIKLITLAILIPAAHFYLWSRLAALRQSAHQHAPNPAAAREFALGLAVVLAVSICVIALSRLKPRLTRR